MRKLFIVLILMLIVPVAGAKPRSPLHVFIEVDGEPVAGTELPLRVTVYSSTDVKSAQLTLTVPEGVQFVMGEASRTLPLAAREAQTFEYRLRLPDVLSGDIEAKLSVGRPDTIYFQAQSRYNLQREPNYKPFSRSVGTPEYELKDVEGETLREYRLP